MQALNVQLRNYVTDVLSGKRLYRSTYARLIRVKKLRANQVSYSGFSNLASLVALLLVTSLSQMAKAQKTVPQNKAPLIFPTPKNVANQLFYVQRDPNTNTIVYALNLTNGQLNKEEPVHAFWIRYAEQGQQKELSYIQRKFAYGLKIQALAANEYELRIVSYKKLPLYLVKSNRNASYSVYATVNQKKMLLKRVYVHVEGGSFWSPNVKYIQFEGTNAVTGETIKEQVTP